MQAEDSPLLPSPCQAHLRCKHRLSHPFLRFNGCLFPSTTALVAFHPVSVASLAFSFLPEVDSGSPLTHGTKLVHGRPGNGCYCSSLGFSGHTQPLTDLHPHLPFFLRLIWCLPPFSYVPTAMFYLLLFCQSSSCHLLLVSQLLYIPLPSAEYRCRVEASPLPPHFSTLFHHGP